jgi:hypothetical protein
LKINHGLEEEEIERISSRSKKDVSKERNDTSIVSKKNSDSKKIEEFNKSG